MIKIYPLSGKGKPIYSEKRGQKLKIKWGKTKFNISRDIIEDILSNYFIDYEKWHPLGASMTNPAKGGLGEYISNKYSNLTPRHASALAAIMAHQNLIIHKGIKPIFIKKLRQSNI